MLSGTAGAYTVIAIMTSFSNTRHQRTIRYNGPRNIFHGKKYAPLLYQRPNNGDTEATVSLPRPDEWLAYGTRLQ